MKHKTSNRLCDSGRAMLVAAALSMLLLLQGCMITRMHTVRAQLCDLESNFRISHENGIHVSFLNPILRSKDILWMTGVKPFDESVDDDRMTMRFIVSKSGAPDGESIEFPVDLRFRSIDDHYKLEQLDVITDLPFEPDPGRIDRMSASACEHKPSLFRRRMVITLAPEDREKLPTRDDVYEVVGAPAWASTDETELRYEFSVAGTAEDMGSAIIELEFDESGTRLIRMKSTYTRFIIAADFEAGEASASFSI